jgi:hypothetical protein
MLHRLAILLSGASLLLCAFAAALWVRSSGRTDHASALLDGQRYTLRSDRGLLTLTGPPRATGFEEDKHIAISLMAGVRNDQIDWKVLPIHAKGAMPHGHVLSFHGSAQLPLQSLLFARTGFGGPPIVQPPDVARSLLAALDDTDRALAAHVTLGVLYGNWERDTIGRVTFGVLYQTRQRDLYPNVEWLDLHHVGRFTLDGVRVTLVTRDSSNVSASDSVASSNGILYCDVHANQSDLIVARDLWHAKLDVSLVSLPWWTVASAFAVLPAIWVARRVASLRRRRSRRLAGRCVVCGYDMRETHDRCPECGNLAHATGASTGARTTTGANEGKDENRSGLST